MAFEKKELPLIRARNYPHRSSRMCVVVLFRLRILSILFRDAIQWYERRLTFYDNLCKLQFSTYKNMPPLAVSLSNSGSRYYSIQCSFGFYSLFTRCMCIQGAFNARLVENVLRTIFRIFICRHTMCFETTRENSLKHVVYDEIPLNAFKWRPYLFCDANIRTRKTHGTHVLA